MTQPRKIAIVTGTRAEYGLLYWLMKEIAADPGLQLQLFVTGAHLEPRFGETYRVIEQDGFEITEKIFCDLSSDTPAAIGAAMASICQGVIAALTTHQPDIVVVLGDRYEMLSVAQACLLCSVPIAHIHGGETTEGLIDEAIRHSLTKMSHLHFAAAEPYRQRIIQMGEQPDQVFFTGAPGLDHILYDTLIDRKSLAQSIGFGIEDNPYFLVTYHPLTLDDAKSEIGVLALVEALETFVDTKIIITGVNADPGSARIASILRAFSERHPERVLSVNNLGQRRYLSAMKYCAAVVGNSSSGLLEAPAMGVPTINIGDRQRGRLKAPSIIDCSSAKQQIIDAIRKALQPEFRQLAAQKQTPYGSNGASERIKEIIKSYDLPGVLFKRFHEIKIG